MTQSNQIIWQRLELGKEEILSTWELKSRSAIEATQDKDSHTVRDELVHFLASLIENLKVGHTNAVEKERVSAQHHGQQRAGLTNYTLAETIKEYSLLRAVLIAYLVRTGPVSEGDREVIHETVDNAVRLASNEFAQAEQAKIKLALAKAEASNRDLDQFAAVAAHDLRSPLSSIAGFAEVLAEDFGAQASKEALECLSFIRGAVKRMTSLIDGILSYAKLNAAVPEMRLISSEEAVKAATQNLKAALTESSGQVSHALLPEVFGDLPLLTQLFQNLFSNAIRYRSEVPAAIEVSVRSVADFCEFEVRDNGIGFDMRFKDVIFEVHKQLDTQQRLEGAGLGLATCRKAVERHGGRIWAHSLVGIGTSFYFTIPSSRRVS